MGTDLARELPEDFVVLANVSLNADHSQIEFDLVVVKPTAIFVVDIKWGRMPRRPNRSDQYRERIRTVRKKARSFSARLRSPDLASQVFADPRVGASLRILPIILARQTSETLISRPPRDFRPAILNLEQAVQYIRDPRIKGRYCNLNPEEIERLIQVLIGMDELRHRTQDALDEAERLLAQSEFQEARARLTEVQAIVPTYMSEAFHSVLEKTELAEDHWVRAHREMERGDYRRAIQLSEEVLSSIPRNKYFGKLLSDAQELLSLTSSAWGAVLGSVAALSRHDISGGLKNLDLATILAPFEDPEVLDLQNLYLLRVEADHLLDQAADDLDRGDFFRAFDALGKARGSESELLQEVPKTVTRYSRRTPVRFLPDKEEGLATLSRFETSTREQLSHIDALLTRSLTDATRALDELLRESVEGRAVAYLREHALEEPLRVHESYELVIALFRAESVLELPVSSLASAIGLPPISAEFELMVTIYAENIRVEPNWWQQLRMLSDEKQASVEFILIPESPGDSELRVEFFYGNRWLQKLTTELVVVS
jgi:tetratricopeptide (TPR) repeat protein